MAREVHGPGWDPITEDLDGEIIMRVGGGKKHGRYWIADSTLDTASTPTPSQIRARSSSSAPPIRPRQSAAQCQIDQVEAQLRQEMEMRLQEQQAMYDARLEQERAMNAVRLQEEVQRQMHSMFQYWQNNGVQPPPLPPFGLPPPAGTPSPSQGTPNNSAGSNAPVCPPNACSSFHPQVRPPML
ncbi:hypothetical protein EJB05_44909 [Eragrostis curvula]|uniref:Uncharacterized protein n=1 Tax=Eragrostis curvula TaxID=38414 RepID=A0A5J9TIZ5_9POAL|nr:hypothetical protein EJB05_44909 [Eragrostis curvula]